MSERVAITDVSPRDGLQNEPLRNGEPIPTQEKAALVRAVVASGVDEVEITGFVSPRWVPQLGDAPMLARLLTMDRPRETAFSALVPNERGMAALLAANDEAGPDDRGRPLIAKAGVFTAASETFSQRNTHASIEETLLRFEPVLAMARAHGLATRGYISCAVECPFEGVIQPDAVRRVAERLVRLGVDEVDLGDTIGRATPESLAAVIGAVAEVCPLERMVVHLHDTFGGARACVEAALDLGIRSFDGAVGGLGGCPYASTPTTRAPGNLATETLVAAVRSKGYETGVDLDALAAAAEIAARLRGGSTA
ncbi:MAG: hydroxymethylglutaryl-CoA lyase [Phycisphaerales bacterium]